MQQRAQSRHFACTTTSLPRYAQQSQRLWNCIHCRHIKTRCCTGTTSLSVQRLPTTSSAKLTLRRETVVVLADKTRLPQKMYQLYYFTVKFDEYMRKVQRSSASTICRQTLCWDDVFDGVKTSIFAAKSVASISCSLSRCRRPRRRDSPSATAARRTRRRDSTCATSTSC